ncbi:transposase [Dendrosporobacter sp. 1207_IL3150]|uniref:transposase n=1 Tax=Dendrosporobacter sp. 1207_IL3150 TaxID=3084054 RepID=UPI002FDA1C7C
MARQARNKSSTGIYHVMLRGNELKPIFLDEEDKKKFVDTMLEKKDGATSRLYAYCVMDNHVHMVIQEVLQPLEIYMKRIGVTYAAYYNKKHNRIGHVFQDRFLSKAIEDDAYLISAIRYIHKNPFGSELSPTPNYLWSSYPSYLGYNEAFPFLPEMEDILGQFSSNKESAIQLFREFHLAEDNQHPFLDIVDRSVEQAENLITRFLESRSMSIEDLRKYNNQHIAAELVQVLVSQCKISCRQIAQLTGINREKVRKLTI